MPVAQSDMAKEENCEVIIFRMVFYISSKPVAFPMSNANAMLYTSIHPYPTNYPTCSVNTFEPNGHYTIP
jgi:hypothetical protein